MITIDILAPGPGIVNYKEIGNIKVGVNDIFKYHEVDYLVLLDHPEAFPPERLEIIKNSEPFKTMSDLDSWSFMPGYYQFSKAATAGDVSTLGNINQVPFHCDSPFTAVALAATCFSCHNIVMWGADYTNHQHLAEHIDIILTCYKNLYKQILRTFNTELFVGYKESALSEVLPVFKNQ